MQVVLHAEVDDECRPDHDRGDQEGDRPTVRRPWRGDSQAAEQIRDRVRRQSKEGRDPKEPTRRRRIRSQEADQIRDRVRSQSDEGSDPKEPTRRLRRPAADEAAVVVESMRRGEIEIGPDRKRGADERQRRGERPQNARNRRQTTL
jgi:hypothetical protein